MAVGNGAVAGTITSVPEVTPSATSVACRAELPELTATARETPNQPASACS